MKDVNIKLNIDKEKFKQKLGVKDGHTPTSNELTELIKPLIPEPIKGGRGEKGIKGDKGVDGINGKDGKTPLKNIDYFDGRDGINGENAEPETGESIIEKINPLKNKLNFAILKNIPDFVQFKDLPRSGGDTGGGGGSILYFKDSTGATISQYVKDIQFGSGLSTSYSGGKITLTSTGLGGTVTSVGSADSSITVTNPTTTPDLSVVQAPKLTTGRTISITGDISYTSPSFDGSANVTAAGTLATVNSNVGSFGSASQVATFTVNGKGLVTAASNTSIAITSTAVTDFTEAAQDATGAMVDSTLVYVDATPLLTRAALTGDITAPQASNVTTLATVNSNVGTFGSATQSTQITANAKGLITAIANVTITPAASSITGRSNLAGTSNQVILSASGTNALAGGNNITLSLPQDIATSSTVQFGTVNINSVSAYSTAKLTINGSGTGNNVNAAFLDSGGNVKATILDNGAINTPGLAVNGSLYSSSRFTITGTSTGANPAFVILDSLGNPTTVIYDNGSYFPPLLGVNGANYSSAKLTVNGGSTGANPNVVFMDSAGNPKAYVYDNGVIQGSFLGVGINSYSTAKMGLLGGSTGANYLFVGQDSGGNVTSYIYDNGYGGFAGLSITEAKNITFGTTTGTKIGTATNEKIGFYNATPIVQPSGDIATALSNLGLVASPTLNAPRALFDHFTNGNNVTTGETDLYSDTLVAGQLGTNGNKILAQYSGTFVGDATSTQRIKAYFGGTLIFDTGALGIGVTTANWDIRVTVIRVSSSVVRCSVSLTSSFATLNAYDAYTEVTGLTLANTQVLKITGTAAGVTAASDQISAKEGYVQFLPAA